MSWEVSRKPFSRELSLVEITRVFSNGTTAEWWFVVAYYPPKKCVEREALPQP